MAIPSEDLTLTVAQLVRAGNDPEAAAIYAGASREDFQDWMRRGSRTPMSGGGRIGEFYRSIVKAEAEAELRDMAIISEAAGGDNASWQAAQSRIIQRRARARDRELARLRELTTD